MILPDWKLRQWAGSGGVSPYNPEHVNPASIDLTIAGEWRDMHYPDDIQFGNIIKLYPANWLYEWWYKHVHKLCKVQHMPSAILASTVEFIELPNDWSAQVKLKTTPCRRGLGHPIADWVDPGFHGHLTLMLHCIKPIELHYGDRLVQLVVQSMQFPERGYRDTGHYFNQTGPTRAWTDK